MREHDHSDTYVARLLQEQEARYEERMARMEAALRAEMAELRGEQQRQTNASLARLERTGGETNSRRRFLAAGLASVAGAGLAVAGTRALPGAQAAAPTTINYQGRLTDASGAPLNGSYNMNFRLWDATT